MTDQLITFKTAELAREAGFKEEQDYQYIRYNQDLKTTYVDIKSGDIRLLNRRDSHISLVAGEEFFSTYYTPTQSLLQKWLREVHTIIISVNQEILGSDEWGYSYTIVMLPPKYEMAKRRCAHFKKFESFVEGFAVGTGTYSGAQDTYEEALEEGLITALKYLLKNKNGNSKNTKEV